MRSPEGIVVFLTDAPSKNAGHCEEGRKPRRGNLPVQQSDFLVVKSAQFS